MSKYVLRFECSSIGFENSAAAPPGGKQVSSICRITVDVYDSRETAFAAASWQRTVWVLRAQTALNLEKSPKEKKESTFYSR